MEDDAEGSLMQPGKEGRGEGGGGGGRKAGRSERTFASGEGRLEAFAAAATSAREPTLPPPALPWVLLPDPSPPPDPRAAAPPTGGKEADEAEEAP